MNNNIREDDRTIYEKTRKTLKSIMNSMLLKE